MPRKRAFLTPLKSCYQSGGVLKQHGEIFKTQRQIQRWKFFNTDCSAHQDHYLVFTTTKFFCFSPKLKTDVTLEKISSEF